MEESREDCGSTEITVETIDEEGGCTVDTKAIEAQEELTDGLEFSAEFSHENVENITSELDSGGVKRKHEDILHIDGSANKTAHIVQTDDYTAVENLEDTDNSLEATITQEHVLSSISQSCQASLDIPTALASVNTSQVGHEPALLPNSTAVEARDDSVNQAWFTTKEDKDSFQGKGVKWKQGMWSKEENDILKENIDEYCKMNNISDPNTIIFDMSKDDRKDFYRTVARGIRRPLFAIYRRVLRMYDRRNYIGKYTPEEVKQLKELKEKHGNDWATIGVAMGRSASSVKDRYRLLRENCQSGKWTAAEEERLSNAVHELSGTQAGEVVTTGISWSSVAEKVQTRSEKQCRSKWLNYLNWKEKGGNEWTKQDEIKLIHKIFDLDVEDENLVDWKSLMANWTSVRSPQWLRSKWWALKKHIPPEFANFRDKVEYLHLHYVDTLQTKIERQESKYKSTRLPHTYGTVLRNIHRPAQHSSNITHTITVNSDGSVVAKGDDISHSFANQGRFEVLQLNSVPSSESTQQTNQIQPSYIIHSMQSTSLAGQTYIIQQPTLVDTGTVQGDQVQIQSPQGVVMTAVLPHHAVRCLQDSNPELTQAIVQTDISGPIEATHLVQTELPVEQTQEQLQTPSELGDQVDLTSLPAQETLINDSGEHSIESNSGDVHGVNAVQDHATGIVTLTSDSLTTQSSIAEDGSNVAIITSSHFETGPAAIAQSLDGTDLGPVSSSEQDTGVRGLQVTPLSLITTYSTPIFSTQTSKCIPDVSQQALQKEPSEDVGVPVSVGHVSFSASETLSTSKPEDLHPASSTFSSHHDQPRTALSHSICEVTNAVELTTTPQVAHHGLSSRNTNLSDSDLVPQADLPEHFLQSQADEPELSLPQSSSEDIVISSGVSPTEMHSGIPARQVVVSINGMTTFAPSDSLMIMGQDGEECVIVEEGCQ